MFIIIAGRISVIVEEACSCFIYWQKAFDRVKWTKLLQIIKNPSIDWGERRLIRILQYMDQNVGSTTAPRRKKNCENLNRS